MPKASVPDEKAWAYPGVPKRDTLTRFLHSGKYSDLIISCGDRTWNVHKVIVFCHCGFLEKVYGKDLQAQGSGVIELHDDHPDAVAAMLEWAYSVDSQQPTAPPKPGPNANTRNAQMLDWMHLNVRVHILAEKYSMSSLRRLAWINITMLTDYYAVHSRDDAMHLTEIGALIYANTPDVPNHQLRYMFVANVCANIKLMYACGNFSLFLKGGNTFGADLVRYIAQNAVSMRADDDRWYGGDADYLPPDDETEYEGETEAEGASSSDCDDMDCEPSSDYGDMECDPCSGDSTATME
ncbi:putative btb poz domain-containing protein [Diplodia seriata]|uniref:Putative btb poz domain-containing protein n=1 Tax=Diplodia seriata TaxID=420778 RepID=A0A0G2DUV7_9PEZI|nr:putative btb poz domain-containing protein [Diplodia seriata]